MTRLVRVHDAIQKLRDGKSDMRAARSGMSLQDKVRQVVKLQRVALPTMRQRRKLQPWERVWFDE